MGEWQSDFTKRIGKAVRHARGDRSAVWLSDRTAKLGMRVSRSGISELESGKRKSISVAEWLILAAALDVTPMLLLFPDYPDGTHEFLPDSFAKAHIAADWVSGDVQIGEKIGGTIPIVPIATWVVGRVRERERLLHNLVTFEDMELLNAAQLEEVVMRASDKYEQITDELHKSGYTVNQRPYGEESED